MDAVTYPSKDVSDYIADSFVPWRVDYRKETRVLGRFHVNWTPTVLFLDARERERYRLIGYVPPGILLAHMMLAQGKAAFETSRYKDAVEHYDRMVREFPGSEEAPQALYFKGVASFKQTGDDADLEEAASELKSLHPRSEWTLRTKPWLT